MHAILHIMTGLNYNPTSMLFINVPSISKLQWHPFTVTSNCKMEPEQLSIVLKRGGSWSQKLFQQLSSSVEHLKVSVEGPYGPTSSHLLRSVLYLWLNCMHAFSFNLTGFYLALGMSPW
jgi:ferric-chelate reductase